MELRNKALKNRRKLAVMMLVSIRVREMADADSALGLRRDRFHARNNGIAGRMRSMRGTSKALVVT
jgi:hypothetical protein